MDFVDMCVTTHEWSLADVIAFHCISLCWIGEMIPKRFVSVKTNKSDKIVGSSAFSICVSGE